jgi:hypothetical protein
MKLTERQVEAQERFAAYVMSCQKNNSDEWMRMLAARFNDWLIADGVNKRCHYSGGQLVFRPVLTED